MSTAEVVIVGAGAAGIGAGMALRARGIPFVILEAAERIGGRAYTDTTSLGVPWDHGCHWLHCARENPLVRFADAFGARYDTRDRDDAFAVWQGGGFVGAQALKDSAGAIAAAFAAVEAAGPQGRDVPIPAVLPDAGRWAGGVNCILALMTGDAPREVSAAAYADYAETDTNWPVLSGLGALIARMGADLPVRTGVNVSHVAQGTTGARVETGAGTLDTRAVIVTASTNVLNAGAIGFAPGPAADLVAQLEQIPCGAYEKVAFSLDALPPEARGRMFVSVDPGDGAPAVSLQTMEGDPPLLIAHFAGDAARDLSAEGSGAMVDYARAHLVRAFGADIERSIRASAATGWTQNPLVRGSYSHARPGAAQLRRDLIAADTGSVAFAGEAFSPQWQATAHGAWQSGQDVAAGIAARLG